MTRAELRRYSCLCREIDMERERLRELEETADGVGAVRPGGTGGGSGVSDPVGNRAARLDELRRVIAGKADEALEERLRLERYIASLEDPYIRMIITARYVQGRSWAGVADCVGGGNTADGVRMAFTRWTERE